VTGSREAMLARIRMAVAIGQDAAAGASQDGVTGAPPAEGLEDRALLELLADRLEDYRALVRRATADSVEAEVAAALAGRAVRRVVVPPGLRLALPQWAEVTVDTGLSAHELDTFDAVVTRAAAAIAETGTIILDGSDGQGRRAITLVPDYHVCVVEAGQVVQRVPDAIAMLAGAASRPLTWISGPSATSDIELERVEGVHGPRTLKVILVSG
jgi:L-lactate dehydrogenase complex protein LldG